MKILPTILLILSLNLMAQNTVYGPTLNGSNNESVLTTLNILPAGNEVLLNEIMQTISDTAISLFPEDFDPSLSENTDELASIIQSIECSDQFRQHFSEFRIEQIQRTEEGLDIIMGPSPDRGISFGMERVGLRDQFARDFNEENGNLVVPLSNTRTKTYGVRYNFDEDFRVTLGYQRYRLGRGTATRGNRNNHGMYPGNKNAAGVALRWRFR